MTVISANLFPGITDQRGGNVRISFWLCTLPLKWDHLNVNLCSCIINSCCLGVSLPVTRDSNPVAQFRFSSLL